jgi:hypothetical protein
VLGWLEMGEDDQPPERIWLDVEALDAHFTAVKERYRSPSAAGEEMESVPLDQNELTKGLRSGR